MIVDIFVPPTHCMNCVRTKFNLKLEGVEYRERPLSDLSVQDVMDLRAAGHCQAPVVQSEVGVFSGRLSRDQARVLKKCLLAAEASA